MPWLVAPRSAGRGLDASIRRDARPRSAGWGLDASIRRDARDFASCEIATPFANAPAIRGDGAGCAACPRAQDVRERTSAFASQALLDGRIQPPSRRSSEKLSHAISLASATPERALAAAHLRKLLGGDGGRSSAGVCGFFGMTGCDLQNFVLQKIRSSDRSAGRAQGASPAGDLPPSPPKSGASV